MCPKCGKPITLLPTIKVVLDCMACGWKWEMPPSLVIEEGLKYYTEIRKAIEEYNQTH